MTSGTPQTAAFTAVQTLDTCGTRCPLPLLRAKQALKSIQAGEVLCVLATDPAAKPDFEAMLRHLPHTLLDYQRADGLAGEYPRVDTFYIRKGEIPEAEVGD